MKRAWGLMLLAGLIHHLIAAEPKVVFSQDFSKSDPGSVPDEFLVLDGQFSVKQEGTERWLELPGAPLDSYGLLFGPSESSGVQVSARISTARQGRKFSTFAVGVSGASGYRLQVAPAKKSVELLKGDTVAVTAPFDWKSGEWTELRLQVRKTADGKAIVEGKVWTAGTDEPKEPTVTLPDAEILPAGKSGAWGMPYAGTPIRFDDLKVTTLP